MTERSKKEYEKNLKIKNTKGALYINKTAGLYIPTTLTLTGASDNPSVVYQYVKLKAGTLTTSEKLRRVEPISWHNFGGLKHLDEIIIINDIYGFKRGKKLWVITPFEYKQNDYYKPVNDLYGDTTSVPIMYGDRSICVSPVKPEIIEYDIEDKDKRRRHIMTPYMIIDLKTISENAVKLLKGLK